MADFDSLLDFGDSTAAKSGDQSEPVVVDEFDPFGPTPPLESKTSDSDLLVDFSMETQETPKQNGISGNVSADFEVSMTTTSASDSAQKMEPSSNPLYELSSESYVYENDDAENPLYENVDGTNGEPVYENVDMAINNNQEVDVTITDLHYEEMKSPGASNPLYDFLDSSADVENQVEFSLEAEASKDASFTVQTDVNDESDALLAIEEAEVKDYEEELVMATEVVTEQTPPVVEEEIHAKYEERRSVSRSRSCSSSSSSSNSKSKQREQSPAQEEDMMKQSESMNSVCSSSPGAAAIVEEHSTSLQRSRSSSSEGKRSPSLERKSRSSSSSSASDGRRSRSPSPKQRSRSSSSESSDEEKQKEDIIRNGEKASPKKEKITTAGMMDSREVDLKLKPQNAEQTKPLKEDSSPGKLESVRDDSDSVVSPTESKLSEEIHFQEMSAIKHQFEEGAPTQAPQSQSASELEAIRQKAQAGNLKTHFENYTPTGPKEKPSVKLEFEGKEPAVYESTPTEFKQWQNTVEGGVFENEPMANPDVIRSSDKMHVEQLPESGYTKSLTSKYQNYEKEQVPTKKRELTPPEARSGKVEYENEPSPQLEVYVGKSDAGVFENQPVHLEDIVRAGEKTETESTPEEGYARNVVARFKQLESETYVKPTPMKREITPDRLTGKVEFVSEPRMKLERYEGKAESGVFESQSMELDESVVRSGGDNYEKDLPEKGITQNLAQKFREIQSNSGQHSPRSPGKRDITPDRTDGRVEYVSEPRAVVETYVGKSESGVFESCPQYNPEVVRHEESSAEDLVLEKGYAKNVVEKFKQLEKQPAYIPRRPREFTPPKESQGQSVFESQPVEIPGVVKAASVNEEPFPEKGQTRNLLAKFRQIESGSKSNSPSPKGRKEFTPPPDSGTVYENMPKGSIEMYENKMESGIYENKPMHRSDAMRENSQNKVDNDLPERGIARNMLSKFKQIENESAKSISPTSPRSFKEFTPPRDNVHTKQLPNNDIGLDASVVSDQYQMRNSPGIFENQPRSREDCLREADTDWTAGMPEKDTAKSLVAKFKNIQAEASKEKPKPIVKKERGSKFAPVNKEKCAACQKTVYAMERVENNKHVYHQTCFKCSYCHARLTAATFSVNQGIMYCIPHFKQLFARKGNYDEGFGRQQHKKRWLSEPNLVKALEDCVTTSSES